MSGIIEAMPRVLMRASGNNGSFKRFIGIDINISSDDGNESEKATNSLYLACLLAFKFCPQITQ